MALGHSETRALKALYLADSVFSRKFFGVEVSFFFSKFKSRNLYLSHVSFSVRSKRTSPGEGGGRGRGGRGYPKMVTNGDIGGRGVCSNGDVTTVFFQH